MYSEEYGNEVGANRCFLATTPSKLWLLYKGQAAHQRHHYEIIRQGSPCHLYFGKP